MPDSRDDCPIANSMGFGASTTTTPSLGVSRVEADDDFWVSLGLKLVMMKKWNWFQKLKRPKKIPQRSPESVCIYIFIQTFVFVHLIFSLFGYKET